MGLDITVFILAGSLGIVFLYETVRVLSQDTKDEHERYNDRISINVNKTEGSALSVNLEKKEDLYDYKFPELLKQRYMKERNRTEDEFYLVQLALKDWFSIFANNTNRNQFYDFPSKEVDELWHLFIIFTKDYREFCQKYLGQFLDHVPLEQNNSNSRNDLRNLMETFEKVRDKNDALLFRIDEKFGINNKFNYSLMSRLRLNKNSYSYYNICSSEDAKELYNYNLISYSDYDKIVNPKQSSSKPTSYSSSSSSSSKGSSGCGSSCGSTSSHKNSCSSCSSCGSSCGGGGCGS